MKTRLFHQVARIILEGFSEYRHTFTEITLGAKRRFEQADWAAVQQASMDRINLYDDRVKAVSLRLPARVGDGYLSLEDWRLAKAEYIELISERSDCELAETFFNSIYCRLFKHYDINDANLFVHTSFPDKCCAGKEPVYTTYYPHDGFVSMVRRILADYRFDIPYENKKRDIANLMHALREQMPKPLLGRRDIRVEMLKPVFYRNKGAYLVGRVAADAHSWPFVLPLLNNEQGGIYIDTLISDPDDVSILFSFTRSYFMVDAPVPSQFVRFLQTLLPSKNLAELYSSIGFYKHGKTEFYRGFLEHLERSNDQFIIAPGIKGMVMSVFTLPSYQTVFKVIKDKFAPPKEVSKATVKAKYHLVKTHDRVGRMADTQEFSNLKFPRHRFSDELLDELLTVAPSTVEVRGDHVLIKHLYTERRMTPLNLYLEQAGKNDKRAALEEYGNAIKQLAAANIFPGDMLLKNFGVTRHGRVVFYDYDEICYLTECNFRRIPPPRFPEDELSSEPWYSVGPNDVFPEEFATFLFADVETRRLFTELHGELFDAAYWQGLQQQIRDGQVVDVFPYRKKKRFHRDEA